MQQENVKAKLWSVCAVDEREREDAVADLESQSRGG